MIETQRLILREITQSDYNDLCKILQDDEVMYAYEGAFNDNEVQEWLEKQHYRYESDGFGLYAVILKATGKMIGQCGITKQLWKGKSLLEIGYLFQKAYWHKGYAIEAVKACTEYAFQVLNANEVFSIIRNTNIPSIKVAENNGMTIIDQDIRHYRGIDMQHSLFSLSR